MSYDANGDFVAKNWSGEMYTAKFSDFYAQARQAGRAFEVLALAAKEADDALNAKVFDEDYVGPPAKRRSKKRINRKRQKIARRGNRR